MTVKDRIKAFCKAEKTTVSAFESTIGVANGYVNAISKSIGIDKIQTILEKFPNLSIEWLLTGRGGMYREDSHNTSTSKPTLPHEPDPTIEKLLAQITDQAIEIGSLREQIRQLKREKGKNVSDAQTSGIADAV